MRQTTGKPPSAAWRHALILIGALLLAIWGILPAQSQEGKPEGSQEPSDLASVPGLAGTLVPDRHDSRFDHPVDLVIESETEMAIHDQQVEAYPELFDNLDVGVAYVVVTEETRKVDQQEDTRRAQDDVHVAAVCAKNTATPEPAVPGRWLPCTGSGNAGSYFVASPDLDVDGPAQLLHWQARTLGSPVDREHQEQGYRNPAEGLLDVEAVVTTSPGDPTVDLVDPSGELLAAGVGGSVDLLNALMSSVFQNYPRLDGFTTTLNGSCDAFREWQSRPSCSLTIRDLQPKD